MDQTTASGTYRFVKELKSPFARAEPGLAIILRGVGAVRASLTVPTGLSATEEAGFVQTALGAVALHRAVMHQTRHNLAVIKLFVSQEGGTVHDPGAGAGIATPCVCLSSKTRLSLRSSVVIGKLSSP
jgi:hypothetical protein